MARGKQKQTTTLSISLTPELVRAVSERVETGLYKSASEVIRQGLRLLIESEQLRQAQLTELRERISTQSQEVPGHIRLAPERLKGLRIGKLAHEPPTGQRRRELQLLDTLDLFHVAVQLTEERLRRQLPDASEEEIHRRVSAWLREHETAPNGDGPGIPASAERMRRLRLG